jgi:phage shock protein A
MGTLTRLADIINANLNALLDKAEHPEKMLRLLVQEMEESLVELRTVAAQHIAQRKQLERQQTQMQAEAANWQSRAERALQLDKDDLARAALAEKLKLQQHCGQLTQDLDICAGLLGDIEQDISRLQAKLSEAKARYHQLQRREQNTGVRLQVRTQQHQVNIEAALQKFDRYEQKIDAMEAELESYDLGMKDTNSAAGLQQQFRDLEQQAAIEQAMTELKQKTGRKEAAHA